MQPTCRGVSALLVLAFVAAVSPVAGEEVKPKFKAVVPTATVSGSVDDEGLQKEAPKGGLIADQKALTALWKAWKLPAKEPKVDFAKEIVVVSTTRGGRMLPARASLGDDGNLRVGAAATRDLRPGFRYQIVVLSREGVKKVNGVDLK